MSLETARVAIANKVDALKVAWAGGYPLVVQMDNRRLIDPALQLDPYLQVEIKYQLGWQVNLSSSPTHRMTGHIVRTAMVKFGSGRKLANLLLTHFYTAMQMSDSMLPVRTYAAIPLAENDQVPGLVGYGIAIPFWHDN